MGVRRPGLERQLQTARQDLAALTSTLDSSGVAEDDRQSHPRWRSLHARRRQLEHRLRAADKLTALVEELQRRKAEKAAAAEQASKPEPAPEKSAKGGKSKGKESKGKESKAKKSGSAKSKSE